MKKNKNNLCLHLQIASTVILCQNLTIHVNKFKKLFLYIFIAKSDIIMFSSDKPKFSYAS